MIVVLVFDLKKTITETPSLTLFQISLNDVSNFHAINQLTLGSLYLYSGIVRRCFMFSCMTQALPIHALIVDAATTARSVDSLRTQLVKDLLAGEDIVTMPVRNGNETVETQLGLNLLKIIQLV